MTENCLQSIPSIAPSNRVEINLKWCKRCGICIAFCPRRILIASDSGTPVLSNPDLCIGCGQCELVCPDFAVEVKK